MPKLDQRVAIITGAASGIGEATALRFAREHARLAITDRNIEGLHSVRQRLEEMGAEVIAIPADLASVDETRTIVAETVSHFRQLHILFNNAAVTDLNVSVEELTVEDWDRCLNVSLRSVFLLSKLAAPEIRRSGGGSIVNTGSVGGVTPWPGGAAYCAAKAALLALTKVLAIELGPWNIRVNTLSPGAVMTPNLARVLREKNNYEELAARSVLNRVGDPAEIAAAAVFLASAEASFITGSNLVVDGGYLAH